MAIPLKYKHYRVLASLYKIEAGDRRDVSWEDFVQALVALDFVPCKPKGGSKRKFLSSGPWPKVPFCWDRPHKGVLYAGVQDDVKHALTARYGWGPATFIPK
ncbi:hypothetical protein BV20DRAFT_1058513 [Pilatotrama ljubarskyi]|nr:hypothetical protein BV20DRAFT_1058513 [Pilatotrama ljubarskyi]